MTTATALNTKGLAMLAGLAHMRRKNRYPSDELIEQLDPNGVHLLVFAMMHNDVEMRTGWYVKVKDSDDPVGPVMLDMEFVDFQGLPQLELED